jgi:hypothetical protein
MATWPATLPAPSVSGYKIKPQTSVVRTDMEIGAPRVRRVSNAKQYRISASWVLTAVQHAAFWAFFHSSSGANAGASWFSISLPVDGDTFETVDARFVGEPDESHISDMQWAMGAELEVRQ